MSDTEFTDIGHGVSINVRTLDGQAWGVEYRHPCTNGAPGPCTGYVAFAGGPGDHSDLGNPAWTVESLEPLTISPSLLCLRCGHHGFIRDGKWVPS